MEKTLIRTSSVDFEPISPETIPEGETKAIKAHNLTTDWQSYGSMAGSSISLGLVCLVFAVLSIIFGYDGFLGLPNWLWSLSLAAGGPAFLAIGLRCAKRSSAAKAALDAIVGEDRKSLAEAAERIHGDVDGWNSSLEKLRDSVLALEPEHATPADIRKVIGLAKQLTDDRQKIVKRIDILKRRTELP